MKRIHIVLAIILVAFTALAAIQVQPARAFANATGTTFGCNSFAANGTSDAPYVTIYAYSYATDQEWWVIVPVTGGKYAGAVNFPAQPVGTLMNYEVWGSLALWTDYTTDPNYWDGDTFFDADAACSSGAGPGVPAGYQLKTVTCDVAVFDAPGGNPIGSNKLKAGQTFYVSPTTNNAPDGEPWVQVFVSSATNPWIPARCVN